MAGNKPALAMAHGINTVLMNEFSTNNLKFATLDIDDANAPNIASFITEVCIEIGTASSRAKCETDFLLKDNILHISRVVPDMELNEEFTLDTGSGRAEQDFPTSGNVQLALETPGLLDTVYFRETPSCDIDLEADEVEIKVKAVGLNMKVGLLHFLQGKTYKINYHRIMSLLWAISKVSSRAMRVRVSFLVSETMSPTSDLGTRSSA